MTRSLFHLPAGRVFRRHAPGSIGLLIVLTLLLAGCTGKSKARNEARVRAAYQAGQEAGLQMQQGSVPIVVLGEVKQHKILWTEGMTLSEAIVQAEYKGITTPSRIDVLRAGERFPVDPKALLRRKLDPTLQPGDVIEIRR